MKRSLISIIAAGLWIACFEFLRNEIIFKHLWVNHFRVLGLEFKTLPLNGMLWVMWSFIMAYILHALLEQFSFLKAMILAWLACFVMMWIVVYNLQALPLLLLTAAIPMSVLELVIAQLIIVKLTKTPA
jgi:hypothetical protein